MLPSHAQMTPLLNWRTVEQHRAVIERAVEMGSLPRRGHWFGDDNSIRRGRTDDMIQMLDHLAAAERQAKA